MRKGLPEFKTKCAVGRYMEDVTKLIKGICWVVVLSIPFWVILGILISDWFWDLFTSRM